MAISTLILVSVATSITLREDKNAHFALLVTNFIYGPKANGVWPPGVSLVGPPGTPGTTGASGTVLGLGEFVGFGAQAALSTTVATGAFRFDTTVANSAVGVASAPGNGGTVFTLQPGTYSFAYQVNQHCILPVLPQGWTNRDFSSRA